MAIQYKNQRDKQLDAMFQLVTDADVCAELIAQGFVVTTQIESEVHAGRQVYVFLKTVRLQQVLSQYDPATYYAT